MNNYYYCAIKNNDVEVAMENKAHLYSELLEIIKKKERDKEESFYRRIELEPPQLDDGSKWQQPIEDTKEERGVEIIELI